jgi:hypothetical protein
MKLADLDRAPSGNFPISNVIRWLRTSLNSPAVTWNAQQRHAALEAINEAEALLAKEFPTLDVPGYNAPAPKKAERTMHWVQECQYIAQVTEKKGDVPAMNRDLPTFIRYCEMQRDTASREGFDDSAQYIQHCLDDLRAP